MATLADDFPETPRNPYDVSGYEDAPTFHIGATIRSLLATIRRNVWLMLSVVAIFLVGAIVLTMLQTPKFTAVTTVEINDRTEQVLGDELETGGTEPASWDVERFLNTQLEILRSRALAERVAQRLDLYSSEPFLAAMQAPLPDEYESDVDRRNTVVQLLLGNFEVRLPIDSRVAQIQFTSTDPEVSADVANAYAQEFIQANLQRRFDSSSYARSFVSDQLEEARAQLETSERELNSYARSAGLIRARDSMAEAGSSNSVTGASLMQLNEAANNAEAARVVAEARWNAERSQPLLSSPAALASRTVQELISRKTQLQAEVDSARERYLGDHPSIQRLEAELATVQEQLNQAANQARNTVRAEYLAAVAAEQRLQSSVNDLQGATLAEQDRAVRYNTLAREADTNRQIYEGLLQRFRELNASAGITASNIAVIDEADAPLFPSSPNLMLNLALALVMGLALATVVVFLKDQLDDRIRVPEEVESKVGLNLIGVVPKTVEDNPVDALADPKSPISEAYSSLRSSLLYSTRHGLPRTLLVTSAQASEGKSTSSYAIARSVARIGKRVLLVDADLRRPSMHRIAGIGNEHGLSSVLVGQDDLAAAISPGPIENLWLMPSGPIPPTPAELLSSPRLMELLEELPKHYDLVVFDSAPVLGLADAPGLAALAEGVLLVIEADRGRGGQLKAAVRRLQAMKPNLLGVLLTKFDPEKAGNQYSAYYGYEYYRYKTGEGELA